MIVSSHSPRIVSDEKKRKKKKYTWSRLFACGETNLENSTSFPDAFCERENGERRGKEMRQKIV